MTQNNEREAFEDLLEQLYWEFDAERAKKSRGERDIFKGKLRFIVEKYKASISQNEQQEAELVCEIMFHPALKVPLVDWKTDVMEFQIGTKLYTSPPKQIPDGWKPTEKEILKYASEEELFLFADESDLLEIANGILELVQIKINAPTTSETNTEVGE